MLKVVQKQLYLPFAYTIIPLGEQHILLCVSNNIRRVLFLSVLILQHQVMVRQKEIVYKIGVRGAIGLEQLGYHLIFVVVGTFTVDLVAFCILSLGRRCWCWRLNTRWSRSRTIRITWNIDFSGKKKEGMCLTHFCLTKGSILHLIGRSTEKGKISGWGRSSSTAALILRVSKDSSEQDNFLSNSSRSLLTGPFFWLIKFFKLLDVELPDLRRGCAVSVYMRRL